MRERAASSRAGRTRRGDVDVWGRGETRFTPVRRRGCIVLGWAAVSWFLTGVLLAGSAGMLALSATLLYRGLARTFGHGRRS
jgi:hypothetical protein